MLWQNLVVALAVVGALFHALRTLLPATWRRQCSLWMLRMPLPAGVRRWLEPRASGSACGGGCSGCGPATPNPSVWQPVTLRRPKKG